MTRIAHISDLHFGAERADVVNGVISALQSLTPDLIVVSGDLTQRARRREFAAARAFLDLLPAPWFAVPGNHDIPLFDVFNRFLRPLVRFRRYINSDVDPFLRLGNIAMLGLNTARSNTWKDGRVGTSQIEAIRGCFGGIGKDVVKLVVTHHPFLPPPGDAAPPLVGRANEALAAAEEVGVDVMLAGHLHHGYTGDIRAHHEHIKRPILVAQAGTATSHRVRNEPNTFNVIDVEPDRIGFSLRVWDGSLFSESRSTLYVKRDSEWHPESGA